VMDCPHHTKDHPDFSREGAYLAP